MLQNEPSNQGCCKKCKGKHTVYYNYVHLYSLLRNISYVDKVQRCFDVGGCWETANEVLAPRNVSTPPSRLPTSKQCTSNQKCWLGTLGFSRLCSSKLLVLRRTRGFSIYAAGQQSRTSHRPTFLFSTSISLGLRVWHVYTKNSWNSQLSQQRSCTPCVCIVFIFHYHPSYAFHPNRISYNIQCIFTNR